LYVFCPSPPTDNHEDELVLNVYGQWPFGTGSSMDIDGLRDSAVKALGTGPKVKSITTRAWPSGPGIVILYQEQTALPIVVLHEERWVVLKDNRVVSLANASSDAERSDGLSTVAEEMMVSLRG
jgi:hypothetical protein